jgi:ribosomal protein L35
MLVRAANKRFTLEAILGMQRLAAYLSASAQGKREKSLRISRSEAQGSKKAGKMPAVRDEMQYYLMNMVPEIIDLSREIG